MPFTGELSAERIGEFWSRVKRGAGCWEWQRSCFPDGYGQFRVGSTQMRAHRVSWWITHGYTPGQLVLHHCDNPLCVRPSHLYLGSQTENMRDRTRRDRNPNSKKTHCPRGHEYSPQNTVINRGSRICRTCKNTVHRHRRAG